MVFLEKSLLVVVGVLLGVFMSMNAVSLTVHSSTIDEVLLKCSSVHADVNTLYFKRGENKLTCSNGATFEFGKMK